MKVRTRFDTSRESIGAARRFVTGIIDDAPVEMRESVAVMVSELSTNALVHAASCFDVVVDRSESAVTVAVTDWGEGSPELQSPGSAEPHGRGLRIVEALSDEWGIISSSDEAKTIWFRVYLRSSKTDGHAAANGPPVLA
jgi:anti-sigma regulatory factor (Ser/Thr protein kinase)